MVPLPYAGEGPGVRAGRLGERSGLRTPRFRVSLSTRLRVSGSPGRKWRKKASCITTRTHPEFERVVYIPEGERAEVVRLKMVVRAALNGAGQNGNGQVAAAALARVMEELLAEKEPKP